MVFYNVYERRQTRGGDHVQRGIACAASIGRRSVRPLAAGSPGCARSDSECVRNEWSARAVTRRKQRPAHPTAGEIV